MSYTRSHTLYTATKSTKSFPLVYLSVAKNKYFLIIHYLMGLV